MGHSTGVSGSYIKSTEAEMITEYAKAIPNLTVLGTPQAISKNEILATTRLDKGVGIPSVGLNPRMGLASDPCISGEPLSERILTQMPIPPGASTHGARLSSIIVLNSAQRPKKGSSTMGDDDFDEEKSY